MAGTKASLRINPFSKPAQQPKRYRLLQLIFLHSKGLKVDINTDEHLAKLPLGRWHSSFFLKLQRELR